MTIDRGLEEACADADRRGLPELKPLLTTLAVARRALRDADWNDDAGTGDPGPDRLHQGCGGPPELHAKAAGREPLTARDGSTAAGATGWRSDHPKDGSPETAGEQGPPARRQSADAPHRLPISALAPMIAARAISSEELTRGCLREIEAASARLNAFVTVTADEALAQARAADAESARGNNRGPLHGIPISLKDLIDQRGVATTAASRVRDGHVAGADAPVTARLRSAGAVLVGKTNLHEFAFGTTSDDTAYGAVHHPRDPDRSPGGSSGGSAVAIVTGMSVASIGTDTGGSIRIPSAACGIVGLKPTWNEIPCGGVVPLSRSLDHVGPLARSVADAWLVYLVLRGIPTAAAWPLPARRNVARLRIGVPGAYFHDVLDDEVRARFTEAIARLRHEGAHTTDVVIPHAPLTPAVYLHTSLPEASAYHAASVERHPDRYTPNVRLRVEMGRYILGEDYVRAARGRKVLRDEVDAALAGCDVLAVPTLPIPAPLAGAASVDVSGRRESIRNMMLRLTQLFNITGHPAISLPCGVTSAGLPCGLQLVGRRNETESLLGVALACEPLVTL